MKMTMKKLKDLSPTAKVYFKNWYLFILYLHRKRRFVESLRELLLKWYPYRKDINSRPIREEFGDKETFQIAKERKNEAVLELDKSKERLSKQQKSELENDVKTFLRRFKLGMEWRPSIELLLITGFFSPPSMNFGWTIDDGPSNEKRVHLILNPDTSIEDIKMHWSLIRKFQKELWPNFKKTNLTEKKLRNMGIATKDLELRSRKELAQFDPDTLEYKRYKASDSDWVGLLWPDEEDISEEADRKRKANLRQIRRRFKLIA